MGSIAAPSVEPSPGLSSAQVSFALPVRAQRSAPWADTVRADARPAAVVAEDIRATAGLRAMGMPGGFSLALGAVAGLALAVPERRRHRAARARRNQSGSRAAVSLCANKPVCAGVVITGGAAGVGFAYADEFLRRGHCVVICDVKDPEPALAALRERHPNGEVHGAICDVSNLESVRQLAAFVKEKIRIVHYWINNAGINGGRRRFTEVPAEIVEAVVKVNLGGILLCTRVAMEMMEQQKGVESHIFNTVGSGVKGGATPGYAAYGATKRGLPQMTDSLVDEIENGVQGYEKVETPGKVNCHTISPGMVFTDLLLNDSTPELRKFPFGVLAAQPEEVGADLVPKILDVSGNGKALEFLSTDKILVKFFQRFVLGQKSEYIDDDGSVMKLPGGQYQDNGVRSLY